MSEGDHRLDLYTDGSSQGGGAFPEAASTGAPAVGSMSNNNNNNNNNNLYFPPNSLNRHIYS
jgi:hypothetical protein